MWPDSHSTAGASWAGPQPPPRFLPDLLEPGDEHALAIIDGSASFTYGDLRAQSRSVATYLHHRGVQPGERVVLVLPNGISFVLAIFAVWRAGAIVVPLDYRSPVDRILALARDSGATAIIGNALLLDKLRGRLNEAPSLGFAIIEGTLAATDRPGIPIYPMQEALRDESSAQWATLRPEDPIVILYTSGSTGRPKGVMHSHSSLIASLRFSLEYLAVDRSERVLVAFPLYHGFALRILLLNFLAGACVVLGSDILAGLKTIQQTRPNALALVPAACALLTRRFPAALTNCAAIIDRVSIGSAAIAPTLLEEVRQLLPSARIDLPYGMTEARIAFLAPMAGRHARRLAVVSPGLELSVVNTQGTEVRVGTGELVLRGPALMLGYWHDTDEDRDRRAREGFHTRDLIECTTTGEWFLIGRADGVIDVGGEKVFPAEIESVLLSHPLVRDACVSGVNDPEQVRGQVPKAAIVADGSVSREEIVIYCRQRLEPYKVPRIVELVDTIERNEVGKVERRPVPETGVDA